MSEVDMSPRDILTLELLGQPLVGTRHLPPAGVARREVGFLFFNAGYVPRDGHAGLSVRAADALAREGFPCWRFDFPGLGDSPGELPETAFTYYEGVCAGGLAQLGGALVRELRRREGLQALVVGGLCGAGTTATYVADRDPAGVAGLFLLEPEFYTSTPPGSAAAPVAPVAEAAPVAQGWRARLQRLVLERGAFWGLMRLLTLENRYARVFRYVPFPRQALLDLLLERHALPPVACVPLVQAWQRVVQRSTPVLVLTAEGKLHEVFFQAINRAAIARLSQEHLTHVRLAGTNHILTTGGAIDAAIAHLVRWARSRFAGRAPARAAG